MTAAKQTPTDPPTPTEGVDPVAAEIAAGYAFTGPALEFGSVVHGGKAGVPVRSTITDFGPVLLSKVMDRNATQESSLGLVCHWADEAGLPLLDLKACARSSPG